MLRFILLVACFGLGPGQAVTMLPGTGAVDDGPPATAFQQPCEAGTELVVRNETPVQTRRVRFVYRLSGTTDVYADVVQWYWNLEQLSHPPIHGYRLMVQAPGSMGAPYDAFVHRYQNPEVLFVLLSQDRSTLHVSFAHIPDGSGVEIRYLMDPALFLAKGIEPMLDSLLEDESGHVQPGAR